MSEENETGPQSGLPRYAAAQTGCAWTTPEIFLRNPSTQALPVWRRWLQGREKKRKESELMGRTTLGIVAMLACLGLGMPGLTQDFALTVGLVGQLAAGLARSLVSAITGANLYRRSSFLLDHLGKQIFPDFVRIHEAPHLPRGLGSAPFDGDGVATRANDLVSQGVLRSYVLDAYSGCRLGMQTTGNAGGVRNLHIEMGPLDRAGLLREMGTGFYVTELMGHGMNPVTGDYSRGASGFWVENGEIQYPVEEITIAGNLKEMFQGLRAVGNDCDFPGSTRTGSWLIDRMTIAGE